MKTHGLAMVLIAAIGLRVTPQAPTSTVRGQVTNEDSGEAMAGVEVTLTSGAVLNSSGIPPEALGNLISLTPANAVVTVNNTSITGTAVVPVASGTVRMFNTVTDASGNFVISGVPVGNYTATARVDGFVGPAAADGVSPTGSAKPVNVAVGEDPPGVVLPMVPGGTIEGRITRSDGKPATGVSVTPYLLTYRDGRPSIIPGGVTRMTDDRGQYRIYWVGPGEYIVGTAPSRPGVLQTDSSSRTFFPGTLDLSEAVKLFIRESAALSGIDFSLTQGGTFSIRGRAVNPLPLPIPRRLSNGDADVSVPAFSLVPRDASLDDSVPRQTPNAMTSEAGRRNGEFEIRGVRPGLYDLFPVVTVLLDGQPRFAAGRTPVEVRDRDVEGLVLAMHPGVELRGRLRVAGDAAMVKTDNLRVALRPRDNIPAIIPARLGSSAADTSGAFVLRHVPEALYTLAVTPMPANVYIADILQNNVSVFDSGIAVGRETPAPLEIVLDTNGQILDGTVIDEKQLPVADATVVLVPPQARRQNPALFRSVRSGADGTFRILGVPPGDYKIFAWRQVQGTAWMNAAFLSRFESQGRNVSVKTGNNSSLRLQVLSPAGNGVF